MPWAIVLGGLASAARFALPGPVERTIAMLADAASPVALFTIGAVLARSSMLAREHRASALVAAAMGSASQPLRQAPLPATCWASRRSSCSCIPCWSTASRAARSRCGVPLGQPALVAIVLVAALPSASNVSMLAERFGADNGRIARIILWTTVAAFFTFPLAAGWVS